MGVAERLRRLDRRVLPPLGRALDRLGGRRGNRSVLVTTALLAAGGVLVVAVWSAQQPPSGKRAVGDVVRVGVVEGDSIPAYVSNARNELDSLARSRSAETYALVSLNAYLAPDRLSPVLSGAASARVYVRVPLARVPTEPVPIDAIAVPADVLAGMDEAARRKDEDAADYQRLADRLSGSSPEERQQRAQYVGGARLAAVEATAFRAHCSCVYALVVRARPAVLQQVAGRPEVRAVDPAPEVKQLDRAVFLPPLPEQRDVVLPPDQIPITESPEPTTTSPEPRSPEPPTTSAVPTEPAAPSATAPTPTEPLPTTSRTSPDPSASPPAGSPPGREESSAPPATQDHPG